MRSPVLAVVGAVLAGFGVVGVSAARSIVEKQREEGLSEFADATIDERTRIRVTRSMGAVFVAVGCGLVAYGIGVA